MDQGVSNTLLFAKGAEQDTANTMAAGAETKGLLAFMMNEQVRDPDESVILDSPLSGPERIRLQQVISIGSIRPLTATSGHLMASHAPPTGTSLP